MKGDEGADECGDDDHHRTRPCIPMACWFLLLLGSGRGEKGPPQSVGRESCRLCLGLCLWGLLLDMPRSLQSRQAGKIPGFKNQAQKQHKRRLGAEVQFAREVNASPIHQSLCGNLAEPFSNSRVAALGSSTNRVPARGCDGHSASRPAEPRMRRRHTKH